MIRRLSRVLLGAALGACAGLVAAQLSPLRGADRLVPLLVLSPVGALLVLLFQLLREEGAFSAAVGGCVASLGSFLGWPLAFNWFQPLGLVSSHTLLTYSYVFAAWGALLSGALVVLFPRTAVGLAMLFAMLVSGNILLAALAVLCLLFIGVRTWARGGY